MSDVFWSIDSLVIKDNVLFGFGWVFHVRHEIIGLQFRLSFASADRSSPEYILADAGKSREDVELAFSAYPFSLNSGYVIHGAFQPGAQISSIDLMCSLADGSILELAVPDSSITRLGHANESVSVRATLRQFCVLFKRAAYLVYSRQFASLFDKVNRYIKGRPKTGLHTPESVATLLRENELENLCVIVDHDLGGGANQYRERLVDSMVKEGRSVIIVTYHVVNLSHVLILRNGRINHRFSVPDKNFIVAAIKNLPVATLVYNTGVSFAEPEGIQLCCSTLNRLLVRLFGF
ncbi:hypothetical protein [Herbaspirillum sp. B65]|uniref:hypothetical protein n=1 Tax=Herbaspirillum sp. B65 TaxID=137708 RepID=UPI0005CAE362|nr:hypothetical protein [Herbaspirillum sp. B65]